VKFVDFPQFLCGQFPEWNLDIHCFTILSSSMYIVFLPSNEHLIPIVLDTASLNNLQTDPQSNCSLIVEHQEGGIQM
jgi:hypothetical protein